MHPKKTIKSLNLELFGKQTASNCCNSYATVQKLRYAADVYLSMEELQQILPAGAPIQSPDLSSQSWCPQHRMNPLALAFSKPAPTQNRKGSAAFVDGSCFATVQFRRDIKEVRRPHNDSECI